MATIKGNSRGNVLRGTADADIIFGLGGADRLSGGDGADILFGDDDQLSEGFGSGDDRLDGGAGRDVLVGGAGADRLSGGDGDDLLIGGFATNVTNDGINFGYGSSRLVDGGNDSYNGGAGFDLAVMALVRAEAMSIDISTTRPHAIRADGVQVGSIRGVEAIEAFLGSGDDVVTGGASGDGLHGGGGDDILSGGGGSDRIEGGAGNDRMSGGEGYDILGYGDAVAGVRIDLARAGQAQDTGGAGTDTFDGFEQVDGSDYSDRITGSAGNDMMSGGNGGSDELLGGGGDDYLSLYHFASDTPTTSLVNGGGGDDVLTVGAPAGSNDRITVNAGDGADVAYLQVAAHQSVDMGSGEDRVVLQSGDGDVRITLGRGVDTIAFQLVSGFSADQTAAHVRDFVTGENGDRIDLRDLLAGAATGFAEGGNPFASGYARLVADETGTELQFDADGAGVKAAFVTILELDGTRPQDFTAFNFGGTPPRAPTIVDLPAVDHHWPAPVHLA